MTSERRIRANRANARASTGATTADGKRRSARNALRHALSLPAHSDPKLSETVETFARQIAGSGSNAELQHLARPIAEAQIDLCRVRQARYQLFSEILKDPYFNSSAAHTHQKAAVLSSYEWRALSRRKFAIRAFHEAQRSD